MNLSDANVFQPMANILYGKNLSEETIRKKKAIYIEGMIRFLEYYATNEIGNVELDIEKISLVVNSPLFENVDVRNITDIWSVFKIMEQAVIHNIPIHRFLKLSPYQQKFLEENYRNNLKTDFLAECEKYPCLKCLFFKEETTSLGLTRKCNRDSMLSLQHSGCRIEHFLPYRQGFLHIEEHTKCKYCTTPDSIPKTIINKNTPPEMKAHIEALLAEFKKSFDRKLMTMENSSIPLEISETDKIDLTFNNPDNPVDWMLDFARAFGNKQTQSEMFENLQRAVVFKEMISFAEIYAQTELGSNYIADIATISEWVDENKFNFNSIEEIDEYIEQMMIDGIDFTQFCKYNEFVL